MCSCPGNSILFDPMAPIPCRHRRAGLNLEAQGLRPERDWRAERRPQGAGLGRVLLVVLEEGQSGRRNPVKKN